MIKKLNKLKNFLFFLFIFFFLKNLITLFIYNKTKNKNAIFIIN